MRVKSFILFVGVGVSALVGCSSETGEADQTSSDRLASVEAGPIYGIGGKCVDAQGVKTADGTLTQLYDCWNGPNQKWSLKDDGTIVGIDGKCLDAQGGNSADGTLVQIWHCTGGPNQKWSLNADGTIVGIGGQCLDAQGGGSADGTLLELWHCTGGPNQKWLVPFAPRPAPVPSGIVPSAYLNLPLTVDGTCTTRMYESNGSDGCGANAPWESNNVVPFSVAVTITTDASGNYVVNSTIQSPHFDPSMSSGMPVEPSLESHFPAAGGSDSRVSLTSSGITVSLNACDSFSAGGYTTDTVDDACSGTLPY